MKRIAFFLLAMVLAAVVQPARAGAELTLQDGTVLSGTTVERKKDGVYLLTREDGEVVAVPVELVRKLRLTAEGDPAATGMREAQPETLAGAPVKPPKTREQLEAFGRPPARFTRGAVGTEWTPRSALGPDVSEFNPVRWFRAPTDPNWTPTPAFTTSTDTTQFNPVRWYRPALDPIWRPTSGFRPPMKWAEDDKKPVR